MSSTAPGSPGSLDRACQDAPRPFPDCCVPVVFFPSIGVPVVMKHSYVFVCCPPSLTGLVAISVTATLPLTGAPDVVRLFDWFPRMFFLLVFSS